MVSAENSEPTLSDLKHKLSVWGEEEFLRYVQTAVAALQASGKRDVAFTLAQLAERALAEGGDKQRAALYYKMYVPSLVVSVAIWILIVASTYGVKGKYCHLNEMVRPLHLYIVLLCVLVAGRLSDLVTTLRGIAAGASELNPGLPRKVDFRRLMPRVLGQIITLSVVSLVFFFLASRTSATEMLGDPVGPLSSVRARPVLWCLAGGLLAAPALTSFAASLSNLLAMDRGSGSEGMVRHVWTAILGPPILAGVASLILCTSGNNWEPFHWCMFVGVVLFGDYFIFQELGMSLAKSRYATRSLWLSGFVGIVGAIIWRLLVLEAR